MEKHTKHTARYQLSRFLQSEYATKLKINGSDIAILMTVFDFMDSGELEMCWASYKRISEISHVDHRTIVRRIPELAKLGLIIKSRGQYSMNIQIGKVIKNEIRQIVLSE